MYLPAEAAADIKTTGAVPSPLKNRLGRGHESNSGGSL